MFNRRAAPTFVTLAWLIGGASAQQANSGAVPSAAPSPRVQATPEANVSDDPVDSVDWRARVAAARQRHADWAARVAARHCSDAPAPDPMDPLLNDDTLVTGDIVSTPQGFEVFRGQASIQHSMADFQ
jgi:hypothetical protein